nr:integrase arm-type DNA-binding domain-containing protein [Gilliamella apicola]
MWRFNYYRPINKIRSLISFGSYFEVSLQQARKQRDEARELIKQGIDPQEYKAEQEQRKHEEITSTFKKIASEWFKVKSGKGLTESTLKRT